jgi:Ca-activated chloride channel family protein
VIIYEPVYLLGLLAIPLLIAGYVLAQLQRRRYTLRFTNLALLGSVMRRSPGVRRHIPPLLFLVGAAAVLSAMTVPALQLEVARNTADVVLVMDVSGSMQATDVAPTRLDAAKRAATTLIDQLPGSDRIALVSFDSQAAVRQGLTTDRNAVKAALDTLKPGSGTAMGDGLLVAFNLLNPGARAASGSRERPAMIVVLTDGVSNQGRDPLTVAQQIAGSNVKVQTIGIGLRNGSAIVRGEPVGGVDEATLSAVAQATGGKYYYAEATGQLQAIYSTLASQLGWQFQEVNLMVPLLIAGISLVVLGAAASLVWCRVLPERAPKIAAAAMPPPMPMSPAPIAAASTRRQ